MPIHIAITRRVIDFIIGPLFHTWPFFLSNAVFIIIGLILLTWVVMPLLTGILRNWLSPRKRNDLYELQHYPRPSSL